LENDDAEVQEETDKDESLMKEHNHADNDDANVLHIVKTKHMTERRKNF
jgi:hypothetical protein